MRSNLLRPQMQEKCWWSNVSCGFSSQMLSPVQVGASKKPTITQQLPCFVFVHTTSDKVENAALYSSYLSGLACCPCANPSSHQAEDFGKRSLNRMKLKTLAFRFIVFMENILKTEQHPSRKNGRGVRLHLG